MHNILKRFVNTDRYEFFIDGRGMTTPIRDEQLLELEHDTTVVMAAVTFVAKPHLHHMVRCPLCNSEIPVGILPSLRVHW
jgi:hypothetical protein